jgi:antitoxin (DNA-binding transcriptional repressor) of toxin-antitoxin stability system
MQHILDTRDATACIAEMIDHVSTRGDHVVVRRDGEPVAALVPFRLYEAWLRRRESFFHDIQETAERVDMAEDEAMALALEAQRAVRAERRR